MNPLDNYPAVRKALYTVQWLVTGILTVAGVVFVTKGTSTDALPQWYILSLAISPVLWAYLGLTAASNTPANGAHRDEAGDIDVALILLVAVTIGVALLLFRVHFG